MRLLAGGLLSVGYERESSKQGTKSWLVKRTPQDRKLRDAKAARENQWVRQKDTELLEQMRKKWTSALRFLKCGQILLSLTLGETQLFACPEGDGA